jgi:hypothetical protein
MEADPMSNPLSKPRRKRPPEAKPSIFRDRRTYTVAGVLLLMAVPPLLALMYVGVFDGFFAARVNEENYEQIKVGMKEKDIRKLLGRPTSIDRNAVPRLSGRAAKYAVSDKNYPLRFVWQDEDDVIWADIIKGRVVKFGATLDGEELGADPDKTRIGQPDKPKEIIEE